MPKHIKTSEILNKVFGRLTVIEDLGTIDHIRYVMCLCECGNISRHRLSGLRKKNHPTQSCGCLAREVWLQMRFKHGLMDEKLYSVWGGMKARCRNKKDKNYYGVRVCKEWEDDFVCFYNWCMSNGWQPGLEIDKDIKYKEKFGTSPGKVYSPEFCCFVTPKVNGNNRSVTLFFEYNGLNKCLSEWCEIYGLNYKLTHQRIFRNNISLEELIANRGGNYNKNVCKLTESQVLEIASSKHRASYLANKFNVKATTIYSIKNGSNWSKLTGIKPLYK